jgi:predicted metalloprotease
VHADIFIVLIVFETDSAIVFCRGNSIQTFVFGRFSHRGAKESEAKVALIIKYYIDRTQRPGRIRVSLHVFLQPVIILLAGVLDVLLNRTEVLLSNLCSRCYKTAAKNLYARRVSALGTTALRLSIQRLGRTWTAL